MPHPYTVDMAKEYLDAVLASDEPIYALEYEGSLSGAISTNDMLGFWLAPAHWGQGLITEACEVIIADHFAQGASLLLSAYHDGNVASQRFHAKLGFKTNGTSEVFSQALNVHVLRQDLILTRDDWEARA
jgi:RimJ/RimL family protein N-acetyltransferase